MQRLVAVASLVALSGCDGCGAPVVTTPSYSAAPGYDPEWQRSTAPTASTDAEASSDPLGGHFTLADATRDLPPGDRLVATITTRLGRLRCTLWPDRAPATVANFVGLANGTRPWKTGRGWLLRPAYDGSSFHRLVPGVALAGGRPVEGAHDAPGYTIADERWPGMRHDRAGLLCARGRAADQVGAELLITAGPMANLDAPDGGGDGRPAFTVFGECAPVELVATMAAVGDQYGRPREPLVIERARVERFAGTESASETATTTGEAP